MVQSPLAAKRVYITTVRQRWIDESEPGMRLRIVGAHTGNTIYLAAMESMQQQCNGRMQNCKNNAQWPHFSVQHAAILSPCKFTVPTL
eukprot:scaffold30325_cov19-Tisochrysis_lutea.AAC.1